MSPVIQATLALTWSTLVGVIAGYYLRKFSEPVRAPFVRVGPLGQANVRLRGACELGEGFANVDSRGSLVVEVLGEDVAQAMDRIEAKDANR